jgi:hypothetical protein
MQLWRISNYEDLSGEGGRKVGGRWHERGTPAVYLAEHPALALLEVLVHLEIDRDDVPSTYNLLRVNVPVLSRWDEISANQLERDAPGWRERADVCRALSMVRCLPNAAASCSVGHLADEPQLRVKSSSR